MDNSSYMNVGQLIMGTIFVIIGLIPVFAVIWVFAWVKDIRSDTRKIMKVLKKRFPDDFRDE